VSNALSLAAVYVGLIALAPLLAFAQRRAPAVPPFAALRRERSTDWLYWLFTPIVTGTLTRACTLGTLAVVAMLAGHGTAIDTVLAPIRAHSPIAQWPLVAQFAVALVVADLVGYWSHRMRHQRVLWPFHAVHHSARALDWLAAARMHPIDDLVDNVLVGLAVLLSGVDARVFVSLGPFLIVHTLLLHANVRWDFGPLRYVLASPAFHRWHHASDRSASHKNFAEIFPFIDIAFGTFHLPRDVRPASFGVPDDDIEDRLGAQLTFPFRRLARMLADASRM
jgi:sterol desaturase/sphingolipid hydroxylase (fatty acid hydroxylase superfamily)